jgi:hypothetical protein
MATKPAPLAQFLKMIRTAYSQITFALERDGKKLANRTKDGPVPSMVRHLVADKGLLDQVGIAYLSARSSVPDRHVSLLDDVHDTFRKIVDRAHAGKHSPGLNHRFMERFNGTIAIAKASPPRSARRVKRLLGRKPDPECANRNIRIREQHAAGSSQADLARQYRLDASAISRIVRNIR